MVKTSCAPVQVYGVLAFIAVFAYVLHMTFNVQVKQTVDVTDYYFKNDAVQYGYMALALKVIFLIIYGYLLSVLCDNKLDKVAWIILFMPYVLVGWHMAYAQSIGAINAIRGKK